MKAYEYQTELEDILESLMNIRSRVSKFLEMNGNVNAKKAREEFNFESFKKDCEKTKKKNDKIIKHVHKLGQATNPDHLSLIYYLANQNKLNAFTESLTTHLKLLNHYKDLKNELKKDNERIHRELENVINKINALNAENTRIKRHFQKRIQELAIKMSKRETETLNLEQFSEFKGKINAKILFSIVDQDQFRMNPKKNSEGKLEAKFGTGKAYFIRLLTRYSAPLDPLELLDTDHSTGSDAAHGIEFLIPPADLTKKFKIKNFDEYQQLIKNKTIESLKQVFKNNPKFFYGHYGKYFNINVNLFLMLSKHPLPLAFVRPQKDALSNKQASAVLGINIKPISVTDPHNVELFISMKYIAQKIMQKNLKDVELTTLHELTHWFTKHVNQDENTLNELFSEGIAAFSEYCAGPKRTIETYFSPPEIEKISRLTNDPLSIEEMEYSIEKNSRISYVAGLYMWLTIYAHKRQNKKGKKCFEHVINKNHLIEIADENANKWLRTFKNVMTPNAFFKQYAEATKKMNTQPIFNKPAMESLIKELN